MIAVDTNIVAGLLRGTITDLPDPDIYIPYLVFAEVKAGVKTGNNPTKYEKIINEFFAGKNVTLSPGIGTEVAECYVEIYAYLRKIGKPVSPNDLWIAAECMQLSLKLLTLDKDFDNIPQIIKVL